jgi:hypothetical protein
MRELKTDDLVIHFNDGDIVDSSRVAAPFQEVREAPSNPDEWAGDGPRIIGSLDGLSGVSEIDTSG